jgi:hypothetical protein
MGGQGAAPPKAECTDASQCQLVNDCCHCEALAAADKVPNCNIQACLQSTCSALGAPSPMPTCSAGRCTLFDCDHDKVLCESLPPTCPPGETPSVSGNCWGSCVPATECQTVADCEQCDPKQHTCVTDVAKSGPLRHCVAIPAACSGKPSCACMGMSVCVGAFDLCAESQGSISCNCPTC